MKTKHDIQEPVWVIDTNSPEGHNLIGKYWWFGGNRPRLPLHMEGYSCAVFRTKAHATWGLQYVRSAYPKAVVRRATLILEYEGRG
jgi:hypothetical protein